MAPEGLRTDGNVVLCCANDQGYGDFLRSVRALACPTELAVPRIVTSSLATLTSRYTSPCWVKVRPSYVTPMRAEGGNWLLNLAGGQRHISSSSVADP